MDSDSTEILEGLTDQHMDLISEGSGGSVYSMNEQKQEDSGGGRFDPFEKCLLEASSAVYIGL